MEVDQEPAFEVELVLFVATDNQFHTAPPFRPQGIEKAGEMPSTLFIFLRGLRALRGSETLPNLPGRTRRGQ